jgi:hypothetical protein
MTILCHGGVETAKLLIKTLPVEANIVYKREAL